MRRKHFHSHSLSTYIHSYTSARSSACWLHWMNTAEHLFSHLLTLWRALRCFCLTRFVSTITFIKRRTKTNVKWSDFIVQFLRDLVSPNVLTCGYQFVQLVLHTSLYLLSMGGLKIIINRLSLENSKKSGDWEKYCT